MAQLSRMNKYRDLRAQMQTDTGSSEYESPDLTEFANRLNQIDADNFGMPETNINDTFSAVHKRGNVQASQAQPVMKRTQSQRMNPLHETPKSTYVPDDEDTFGHDYLDQYIREVKKYNIEQGNAASENTQVNILKSLENPPKQEQAPTRPFPRTETRSASYDTDKMSSYRPSYSAAPKPEPKPEPKPSADTDRYQSQALTREDIMAEVQYLMNSNDYTTPEPSQEDTFPTGNVRDTRPSSMSEDTFNRHLEAERNTRQQLLNETAQMRAQLDDYEDNLSEVTDKMRQTNRILNIVLVILIIALAVILGVVIYWIMNAK